MRGGILKRLVGQIRGDQFFLQKNLTSKIALSRATNILISGGLYDRISPITDLEKLTESWPGSKLLREKMRQVEPLITG